MLFVNDCAAVLPSDGFLLYADDLKIFRPVSSIVDCVSIQNDPSLFGVNRTVSSCALQSVRSSRLDDPTRFCGTTRFVVLR